MITNIKVYLYLVCCQFPLWVWVSGFHLASLTLISFACCKGGSPGGGAEGGLCSAMRLVGRQTGHNDFNCDSNCCDLAAWHFNQTSSSSSSHPPAWTGSFTCLLSPLQAALLPLCCSPDLPLHIFAIQRKAYLTLLLLLPLALALAMALPPALALALLRQACGMLAFPLFTRRCSCPSPCSCSCSCSRSLQRFDAGAAQVANEAVALSLLMLVNCKYLINLHGYFYASKRRVY